MIRKIIFFLCLLPSVTFADTSAKSELSLAKKNKKTLTVAIEEIGYFPFNYQENGKTKGFSIDVLNYFKANSKYDFKFVTRPWPRALYALSLGKVDLILTLFKASNREQTYHFIEPHYAYEANQLFTLAENKIEFKGDFQQLKPYFIGTTRDYSYGEAFDQADYLNKLPALNEKVLLKLLITKRVDMIVGNPFIFKRIITQQNQSSQIKAIDPYVAITPVHMVLTKEREDSQEIKQTLEKLTKQLKASSYYQELLNKYQLNFK